MPPPSYYYGSLGTKIGIRRESYPFIVCVDYFCIDAILIYLITTFLVVPSANLLTAKTVGYLALSVEVNLF